MTIFTQRYCTAERIPYNNNLYGSLTGGNVQKSFFAKNGAYLTQFAKNDMVFCAWLFRWPYMYILVRIFFERALLFLSACIFLITEVKDLVKSEVDKVRLERPRMHQNFRYLNPIPTKGGRFCPPSQTLQLTFSPGYVLANNYLDIHLVLYWSSIY